MKIETKYNFGQKVYPIVSTIDELNNLCEVCDGNGVFIFRGTSHSCEKCRGSGHIIVINGTKWQSDIFNSFVIGRISTEFYNPKSKIFVPNSDKIIYMGLDYGSCWKESEIFPSIEEAKKECLKRNDEKYDR